MSDQEEVITFKRRKNKLNLDSEEQARIEEEERQKQEQIRQRQQEKRRRREQRQRKEIQQEQRREALKKKYEDPRTMLEPDSNSHDTFMRVEKKIRRAYPEIKLKQEPLAKKKKVSSSSGGSESDESGSDSQSESESSQPKRKQEKKQKAPREKKQRKERKVEEVDEQQAREARQSKKRAERVKVQEKDAKSLLIDEVAIRWWYCLPEWPPADYPYERELNKLGYRVVDASRFRMEENLLNGLYKVMPVDGYVGIYKSKVKLIDVRPKNICPSANFLKSKTVEELTELLRTALTEQIRQLQDQKYQTEESLELMKKLSRQLKDLK